MTTKDIRTAQVQVSCDVCGRTLLRGERAETYLAGGSRRQVIATATTAAAAGAAARPASSALKPSAPRLWDGAHD